MTLDKLVTTDLTALAVENRQRPVMLDATLRAIGVARDERLEAPTGVALLSLSRTFAHRVARATAGASALVLVSALLALLVSVSPPPVLGTDRWYLDRDIVPWAVAMIVVVAMIYFASYCAGAKRFARSVTASADPERKGRMLVLGAEARAVWLGVAGTTAFVAFFGSLWFTIGDDGWGSSLPIMCAAYANDGLAATWVREIALAIGLVVVAAAVLGRAVVARRRTAVLESTRVIAFGIVLGLVSLYLAFQFDIRPPWTTKFPDDVGMSYPAILRPVPVGGPYATPTTMAVRGVVMVSGTLAVFLVVTALTLRRRRRELAALAVDATGSSPAPPAPLSAAR